MKKARIGMVIDYNQGKLVATVGRLVGDRINPKYPISHRMIGDSYENLLDKIEGCKPQGIPSEIYLTQRAEDNLDHIYSSAVHYANQFPNIHPKTHLGIVKEGAKNERAWGLIGVACLYHYKKEEMTQKYATNLVENPKKLHELLCAVSED